VLTFYSEGFVRTVFAVHCIQWGAWRLTFDSSQIGRWALGHSPPVVIGSPREDRPLAVVDGAG
jgi:hypothetical protein